MTITMIERPIITTNRTKTMIAAGAGARRLDFTGGSAADFRAAPSSIDVIHSQNRLQDRKCPNAAHKAAAPRRQRSCRIIERLDCIGRALDPSRLEMDERFVGRAAMNDAACVIGLDGPPFRARHPQVSQARFQRSGLE